MNPSDNNSTILIIIDEPNFEEYIIKNKTSLSISYSKYNQKQKKTFEDQAIIVKSCHKSPFVWNYRENLLKRLQIGLVTDDGNQKY